MECVLTSASPFRWYSKGKTGRKGRYLERDRDRYRYKQLIIR